MDLLNIPKYSVKDILILAREAGLPEACVIAIVNELLSSQSKLLGSEDPPSREAMLEVMKEVGYTEYEDKIGFKEGGAKKTRKTRKQHRMRRKT